MLSSFFVHISEILLCLAVLQSGVFGAAVSPEAVTLARRQNATSADLTALTDSIEAIAAAVNSSEIVLEPFQGGTIKGLFQLLQINSGVVALGNAITNCTTVAEDTPTLDVADSTTIGTQFLTLQPQITTLLTTLEQKRPQFDKAGFGILDVTSLIKDDLTTQQSNAEALGNALVKTLDPSLQPIATPILAQIQGNFTAAINAFQGRGGAIVIPAQLVPGLSDLLAAVAKALGISDPEEKDASTDAAAATAGDGNANLLFALPDLSKLAPEENDLSDIPLPVLAVLKQFGVV